MDLHHHNDESDDELEAIDNIRKALLILILLRRRQPLKITRQPSNRCWTGQNIVDNLLQCGSSIRIKSQLRMELNTFYQLRDWLLLYTQLRSSSHGSRSSSIEEKLMIFISIASTNGSNRTAQERFNRSAAFVSK